MSTKDNLWTPNEIAEAVKGRWLVPPAGEINITGATYYMGQINPGDLIFTVSKRLWGNKFIDNWDKLDQMKNKGARLVITDNPPTQIPDGLPVYIVKNTFEALRELGKAARTRFRGKVVCVTGSVGKSTTKHGIAALLSKQGLTNESNSNFNHAPGVPLSIAQTPAYYDYGVFEFGVDAPIYTLPKAKLANPHVAVVTEIQNDHHIYYPTLEAIVDQKSLLFTAMAPDNAVVLNRDSAYYFRLKTAALANNVQRIISFGAHRSADIRLLDYHCDLETSRVKVSAYGKILEYSLSLPGAHNVRNSLAMLAAVCGVNANLEQAAADLVSIKSLPNHCLYSKIPFQNGEIEFINDIISANPASVKAAIEYFKLFPIQPGGRKILILGEMGQLGAAAATLHASLADPFQDSGIDKLFAIGPNIKNMCDIIPKDRLGLHTLDENELIDSICKNIKPKDIIMIKGSLAQSNVMEQAVARIQSLGTSKS